MRILTLLVVEIFLWISASSSERVTEYPTTEPGTTNSPGEIINCHVHKSVQKHNELMLICSAPVKYNISCYKNESDPDDMYVCNGSTTEGRCLNVCDNMMTTKKHGFVTDALDNMTPNKGNKTNGFKNDCSTITSMDVGSELSTSSDVNTNDFNSSNSITSNSITVAVFGAFLGLLVVILALVIIGWISTCMVMRKRGRMNAVVRSSADDLRLNNPTYSGDDILQLQPPSHAPTYETIQPNPTDGDKLALTQQGDSEYNVLNRNQNTSTKTASLLETIHEDDIEVSYSKLELTTRSNGCRELVNDGDYSNLESVAIESTMTDQAAQSITASEEGGVMNDKGRKDENVTEEASTEEGATQLENKVAQKVGEEEGEQEGEGEEQHVLLLVTTTTDERKFGNGSDNAENDDLSMTTNPSYNMMRMRNK